MNGFICLFKDMGKSQSNSQVLYVDSTSTCSDCDGSKNNPYASLRSALSKAGNDTTIYIARGFYAAAGEGLNREDASYVVPDGTAIRHPSLIS